MTPDLILTSDWHLRDTQPPCRSDNFWETQWKKVKFISELQRQHGCPVIHAGDLFDHWKPSPLLLTAAIRHLPAHFCTIYGNHDLPQHSLELANKCGIKTLEAAGKLTVMPGVHWGTEPDTEPGEDTTVLPGGKSLLVWHVMTYQGKPWFGCTDTPAAGVLRKYKYDLIVTGHNHQSFVEEYQGRLLVNPGGITRQESDKADFTPRVYLYYRKTNTVEPVFIPVEPGVVTAPADAVRVEERNERIEAFVSKLNADWDSSINFELNMERYLSANKIQPNIQKIVYKAIGL